MDATTWIGISASALTSFASLPQLIKIARERKAKDVSVVMLAVLITGLVLWVGYGVMLNDTVILMANAIAFVINLATLILVIRYKNSRT